MSLARPVDSSPTSYGEPKHFVGKSTSNNTNLSSHMYSRPEKQIPSYCSDISDQQCYTNTTLVPIQQVEFVRSSHPAVSGCTYQPHASSVQYQLMHGSGSSTRSPHAFCFSKDRQSRSSFSSISHPTSASITNGQSPKDDVGCEGDEIRSKLEEIEKALLNDSDEDWVDGSDDMGIDEGWVAPIKDFVLPTSPKESSDSNLGSAGSSKETRTPKQLLFDCAVAISESNYEEASVMVNNLRKLVSIQGDPPQRLAACLVEGLVARMACSGQGIYKALRCKEPPSADRLSAMQILFEVCPYFKFGVTAANGAIIEAAKDEKKVHIIDFDINQGGQYITLLQALSSQTIKPRLRITGVDDPESVERSIGGLRIIGQRLENLAEQLGIPFEFQCIPCKTADVTSLMLDCRSDEALLVNFAYQLHHMPDESVSTVNQRDKLLRMVKGLGPKLVTVVEQDVNTNTAPFFPRFVEVYNYYNAVFASLDATLPRNSRDRMNVERQCLAKDIVNIVACEGADRIERYEAAGKWRARMAMAGFVSCPLSSYVNDAIRAQLKSYCDMYKIKEEAGALYFGWEDKILVATSAWK